jgi:hypothetical protein
MEIFLHNLPDDYAEKIDVLPHPLVSRKIPLLRQTGSYLHLLWWGIVLTRLNLASARRLPPAMMPEFSMYKIRI